MLIRCPTCASGYELAPELLPRGRILRCAHCRDAWACSPSSQAPGPNSDTAADLRNAVPGSRGTEIVAEARFARPHGPLRIDGPSRPRGSSRRAGPMLDDESQPRRHKLAADSRRFGAAAAAALLLAVSGGGMAALAGKEHVVAAFPPSAAVFATLGLPVNLRGLAIGETRSTVTTGDGAPTLTLEGRITNLGRVATPIPWLRFAVRDKDRRELYHWTSPAPKPQLGVGETVLFHGRLSAPPRDGQDLAVSFTESSTAPRRVAEAFAGE